MSLVSSNVKYLFHMLISHLSILFEDKPIQVHYPFLKFELLFIFLLSVVTNYLHSCILDMTP